MRSLLPRPTGRLLFPLLSSGLFASVITVDAHAYSTESIVSDPCHERITMRAIRDSRASTPELSAIAPQSRDDRALLDDLPFEVDRDLRDLATATLILANRHVDLQGNEPDDLDQLAQVHGNPSNQAAHCLRRPNQDDPEGPEQAVEECREFIRGRIEAAIAGFSVDGVPDPADRVKLDVFLELRGSVEARLPRFYFHVGEALHALQDSFSHTYRTQDHLKVVTVLNYIELVEGELDESVDGPAHSSELDRCQSIDDFRQGRVAVATRASADLMRAAIMDGTTGSGLVNVEQVLDAYLTPCSVANDYCGFGSPCGASNNWCDAKETEYVDQGKCVCSAPGRSSGSKSWPMALFAVAAGAVFCRRGSRRRAMACAAAASAAVLAFGSNAAAQEPYDPAAAPPAEPAPEVTPPPDESPPPPSEPLPGDETPAQAETAAQQPNAALEGPILGDKERGVFPFGVHLGGSLAVENAAFAAALGFRYRVNENFLVGVDGEYNPWFSWRSRDVRPGTVNVFATGILRFPLQFQRINLRSTLQLGISRMNFDLYGVPEGSIGPFIGVNVLGVDIGLAESVYLVIDPAHVVVPIPQVDGVPFAYPQYRFTIGLQLGA